MPEKKASKAASPPAEAPMLTIGKTAGFTAVLLLCPLPDFFVPGMSSPSGT
jgi:hypothetical protein